MSKARVAVYGSLRKHCGNDRLLSTSIFLGEDWTDTGYKMYSLGGFPGVVQDPKGGKVKIEVYEVSSETLARCDMLEGFRGEDHPHNFYNRKVIDTQHGPAYIYLINGSYSERSIVENGDWAEHLGKSYGH